MLGPMSMATLTSWATSSRMARRRAVRFPRTHGDRPITNSPTIIGCWVPPHKWAVGTSFEWEFEFPMTTNLFYELKPEPKRKTRKPANPKPKSTRATETSKPAAGQATKPKASKKPQRARLTLEERQERARARAAETRSKLKDASLCRDCRQPAIPGQTRCSDCAEKNRESRGPR